MICLRTGEVPDRRLPEPHARGNRSKPRVPQSTHVIWPGLRSRQGWALVRRTVRDGHVLVTNDTADFASLMVREPRHPGLIRQLSLVSTVGHTVTSRNRVEHRLRRERRACTAVWRPRTRLPPLPPSSVSPYTSISYRPREFGLGISGASSSSSRAMAELRRKPQTRAGVVRQDAVRSMYPIYRLDRDVLARLGENSLHDAS